MILIKELILSLFFLQLIDGQPANMTTLGQSFNISTDGQIVSMTTNGQAVDISRPTAGQAVNKTTIRQAMNITTDGQAVNMTTDGQTVDTSRVGKALNKSTIGQVVNKTTIGQVINMTTIGQGVNTTSIGRVVNMTAVGQTSNLPTVDQIITLTSIREQVATSTPSTSTKGPPDIESPTLPPLLPFVPFTPHHTAGRVLKGCTVETYKTESEFCSFKLRSFPSRSTKRFLKIYIPEVVLSEFIILSKLSPLKNGVNYVHINQTSECFQYVVENDKWVLIWFGNQNISVELRTESYQESKEHPYCHLEICNVSAMNYTDQTCTSPTHVIYYDDTKLCESLYAGSQRQSTIKRAVDQVHYDCSLSCAQNCTCTLGNTKLITECSNGIVHSSLIVLQLVNPKSLRLYFGSTIMNLDSDAFLTVNEIEELYMSYAGFITIDLGAFNGLKRLQKLILDHNNLLEIHRGLFNHLHNLIDLDISHNTIWCISLGSFEGLWRLNNLDVSHNLVSALPPGILQNMTNLIKLELQSNSIATLHPHLFFDCFNLQKLDLSSNLIAELPLGLFRNTLNLRRLELQNNTLETISDNTFEGLCNLKILDLASNRIAEIQPEVFRWSKSFRFNFDIVVKNYPAFCGEISEDNINITFKQNEVPIVSDNTACQSLQMLTDLDLTDNNLQRINFKTFASLNASISVDEDWICCFIPPSQCESKANKDVFLTCDTLLPDNLTRTFLWIFAFMACLGNGCVLVWRLYSIRKKPGNTIQQVQSILIMNLALSDLLMGIYLFIIVSADAHFGEYFPAEVKLWRESFLCNLAGVLSMLSSEASIFLVTLISIDRLINIKYPFSSRRLGFRSTCIIACVLWIVAVMVSIIPVIVTSSSSSQNTQLYSLSEVCVALPLARQVVYIEEKDAKVDLDFVKRFVERRIQVGREPSLLYSLAIFVAVNGICCIIITVCYVIIFVSVKSTAARSGRSQDMKEQVRMATKMAAIVMTDLLYWLPIIILSIIAQADVVKVPAFAHALMITVLFPINSAVNPFLYTMISLIADYLQKTNTG